MTQLGAAGPTAWTSEEKQVQAPGGWRVLMVWVLERRKKAPVMLTTLKIRDTDKRRHSGQSTLFHPLPTMDCKEHTETVHVLRLR